MTRFDTSTLQFPPSANSKFRAPTFSTRPVRAKHCADGGFSVYQPWRPRRPPRSLALARACHSAHAPLDNLARGVTTYRALFTTIPIRADHFENQLTGFPRCRWKRSSSRRPPLYHSVIASTQMWYIWQAKIGVIVDTMIW